MFDPGTVAYNGRRLLIIRWESTDYGSRKAPLSERLNPLRYAVSFFPRTRWLMTINKKGRAELHRANFFYRLKRRKPASSGEM